MKSSSAPEFRAHVSYKPRLKTSVNHMKQSPVDHGKVTNHLERRSGSTSENHNFDESLNIGQLTLNVRNRRCSSRAFVSIGSPLTNRVRTCKLRREILKLRQGHHIRNEYCVLYRASVRANYLAQCPHKNSTDMYVLGVYGLWCESQ